MLHQLSLIPKPGDTLPQSIEIIRIPNGVANKIVLKHHYLHRVRTGGLQLSHGVLYKGQMLGCLVWASPTFHSYKGLIPPFLQKEVVELARFWLHDDMPFNSETASLSRGIKLLRIDWLSHTGYTPKIIVSYSDLEVSHQGTIYKAANFEDWGFAKSALMDDIGKDYSRNRERWGERYTAKGLEIAPRSASTKRMYGYHL